MPESVDCETPAGYHHRLDRRSFASLSLLAMQAALTGGFLESTRPHREQSIEGATQPRTKEELISLLRKEFGANLAIETKFMTRPHVAMAEKQPARAPVFDTTSPDGSVLQEPVAAPPMPSPVATPSSQALSPESAAQEVLHSNPCSAPLTVRAEAVALRVTETNADEISSAWNWLQRYRLSEEEAAGLDPEELDCNDHANIRCHRLTQRYGMPMHLISFWPKDARKTGRESWHLVAACKLGDNHFLIMENDVRAIFWHGTLAEYGETYPLRNEHFTPMEVMPDIGISRYVRPAHDTLIAKIVLQIGNTRSEQDMEQMKIPEEQPESLNLARREIWRSLLALLKPSS